MHCGFPDSLMLHWRACRYCLAIGDSSILFSCKTAHITWFFCLHWQPPWRHLRLKPLHFLSFSRGKSDSTGMITGLALRFRWPIRTESNHGRSLLPLYQPFPDLCIPSPVPSVHWMSWARKGWITEYPLVIKRGNGKILYKWRSIHEKNIS